MARAEGYCSNCPAWFVIPDTGLSANHLCPTCLQPASKVRHGTNPFRSMAQGPTRVFKLLRSVLAGN